MATSVNLKDLKILLILTILCYDMMEKCEKIFISNANFNFDF